jgi:hypothetical protein
MIPLAITGRLAGGLRQRRLHGGYRRVDDELRPFANAQSADRPY